MCSYMSTVSTFLLDCVFFSAPYYCNPKIPRVCEIFSTQRSWLNYTSILWGRMEMSSQTHALKLLAGLVSLNIGNAIGPALARIGCLYPFGTNIMFSSWKSEISKIRPFLHTFLYSIALVVIAGPFSRRLSNQHAINVHLKPLAPMGAISHEENAVLWVVDGDGSNHGILYRTRCTAHINVFPGHEDVACAGFSREALWGGKVQRFWNGVE